MLPATTLELAPSAKINLGLEVLRRREDGYHNINTVFLAVSCHDHLLLTLRDDDAISCQVDGSEQVDSSDNLCVRAATMLRDRIGNRGLGLDIQLTKRIPVGAGLGGGSSDAAATLLGASRLWRIAIGHGELATLAAALGSDVPFFLYGGAMHAGSRGELLSPLDLSVPYPILLVNPGIHVATPWAYRAVGRVGERAPSDLPALLRRGVEDPTSMRELVVNDFEEGVFAAHPELAAIKRKLYDQGALFALMSGSGSTLFGVFSEVAAADAAARAFDGVWRQVVHEVAGAALQATPAQS